MDPHRSVFRNQWPASSYAPARFPSPVYGTPPIVYSPVGSTIPIGVSFSSRSLASSRDLPPSPTYPHRRGRYEDTFASTSYTSTTSSSGRYGHSPSTRTIDPYDISIGGSSTSCSHSSKLSRRIDSFLKTSEQTIERVSRRRGSGSSWITAPDSPDLSLSLSGRAYRSTSAASIAVKAKKHLNALNDCANKTSVAGCSTSDSLDDLDSDSDDGLNEVSDDTSADLSKLDDLSSDSDDDEFFDVVPLGHRAFEGSLPLKDQNCKAPVQPEYDNSSLPLTGTQVGSPGMGNLLGGGNTVVAAASIHSDAASGVASSTASSITSTIDSTAICGSSSTVTTSVVSDINTATAASSLIAAAFSPEVCTAAVPSTVTSNAALAGSSCVISTSTSSACSVVASTVDAESIITSASSTSSSITSSTHGSIVSSASAVSSIVTFASTTATCIASSSTTTVSVTFSPILSCLKSASTVSCVTSSSTGSNIKSSLTSVPSVTSTISVTSAELNGPTLSSSVSSMASTGTPLLNKLSKVPTPSFGDGPATPSPSHKKYQAPLPPGSLSRQASSASIARSSAASEVPLSRQLSSASIARHSINFSEEGNKCQRAPSFKKYPAPSPPGLVKGNSSASINSTTDASKFLPSNDTNYKKKQNPDDTSLQLSNGDIHSNVSSVQTNEGLSAGVPMSNNSNNSTKVTANGHVEDILNAFQRGASESMQLLKAAANTKNDAVNSANEKAKSLSNGSSLEHSSSCDVSVNSSVTDDENSKRSSRDPGTKKSSRKLGSLASKFEATAQSSIEVKNTPNSPTEMKSRKFSIKAPTKNKLGNLASKFEASDSSTAGKDAKTTVLKLQSPYTDLVNFIPPSVAPPVVQRKSIGGINVSKFGGTGKFPTHQQLRKMSKTNSEEKELLSSDKLKEESLSSEVDSSSIANTEVNNIDLSSKSRTDETVTRDSEKVESKNNSTEVRMETTITSVASTAAPDCPITVPDVENKKPKTDRECSSEKNSLQNIASSELVLKSTISPCTPTTVELSTGISSSEDPIPSQEDPASKIDLVSSVPSAPKICTSTTISSSTQSVKSETMSSKNSTSSLISTVAESNCSNFSPSLASISTPDPAVSVALLSSTSSPASAVTSASTGSDTSSSATVEGKLVLLPAGSSVPTSVNKSDEPAGEDKSFVSTGARPKLATPASLGDNQIVLHGNEYSTSNYESMAFSEKFQSPKLELSSSSYSKYGFNFSPSENDSPEVVLTPSIALPSASIFTRASSVSPSINISRSGENGLNACLSEEIFSRARSLTPLEGTGERRSFRPKSKYLQSGSASSPLDLGRHESALEKYRRRKEMRDSAAKVKLEALTKPSRDVSLSDSTLSGDSLPQVQSSEKSSRVESSKFKIDLSSIKDFLKKTEEEIGKLPRYIREPWTVTEFLSGTKNSDSSLASSTTDTTADQAIGSTNAPIEGTKSPSDDLEVGSAQHRRSSEGDVEVYVDARERIDTSQLDTLMPLPDTRNLERRCRSVTPSRVIANTEKILSQTDRLLKKSRSGNSLRKSYSRSICAANVDRLAEVVADLAEEHSTAQLAGERLEAEQADRMRLEKELDTAQGDMRELSIARERLEHEKSVLRVEMLQHSSSLNNGDINEADDASSASLYKRKYEWSQREVETLKQQLRQHQQDEAEQTALLKKQLEKKINDAREETEEQRQVAGQLKKRTQRLQAEMNDLKILLEEQSARNSLLEKKQRKFDSELAAGQDELRLERLNKEKVMRERDAHLAEKYAVDQELSLTGQSSPSVGDSAGSQQATPNWLSAYVSLAPQLLRTPATYSSTLVYNATSFIRLPLNSNLYLYSMPERMRAVELSHALLITQKKMSRALLAAQIVPVFSTNHSLSAHYHADYLHKAETWSWYEAAVAVPGACHSTPCGPRMRNASTPALRLASRTYLSHRHP
ncbi:hypothetical protein FHG87_006689 [Trinorchestia longiramus]|nr:hypothetical protein FHG87_006689 [Trinorchestia longiramus]